MKKTERVEDGSEFLNEIDEFDPDLVTLDVMMPWLTTSEILKKTQRKKKPTKDITLDGCTIYGRGKKEST